MYVPAVEPCAIAVSATFTAEPVSDSLRSLLSEIGLDWRVSFGPYNQIFQSLLDPHGIFALNHGGLNVVLLRWQDFDHADQLHRNVESLCNDIRAAAQTHRSPALVISCPCSAGWTGGSLGLTSDALDEIASALLEGVNGVTFLPRSYQQRLYPVAEIYDARAERLGNIPYTAEFFAALGAIIARFADGLRRSPIKVIVLDCDNTLWRGVVGEEGPRGIALDTPARYLHDFVVAQQKAGMLVALCSKNNEADVLEAFQLRDDFPLQLSHVIAHRINWQPKSVNLRSLARELDLGLDSFVFIDDDAKECAEIESNCPEVLTCRLPEDRRAIPDYLNHLWPLDHWTVTSGDTERTAVYVEKLRRERLQRESGNLDDFIAGLRLVVDIAPMVPERVPRVAQLTQRTNQFNCTTIRRTEADVLEARFLGFECLTITVSDRFGDYGLVGAVLFRAAADALEVETFVLSCRALGRGVEHRILRHLGGLAVSRGLPRLDVQFRPTAKNAPAWTFLSGLEGGQTRSGGSTTVYEFASEWAAHLEFHPVAAALPAGEEPQAPASSPAPETRKRADYVRLATSLRTGAGIVQHLRNRHAQSGQGSLTAPRSATEAKLLELWSDVLGRPIGVDDNYFDCGGDSITAVRLLSTVMREFAIEDLTLSALLHAPTVARFACLLVRGGSLEYQTIVPMRSGGDRPPFYLMHGGGGNILSLRELAQALPDDLPVYCLQAPGLDGSPPLESVEAMAARYVAEIRNLQQTGPYYFGGHCYGGLVAFEMARIFHSQGQEVGLVALMDAYNFAYGQLLGKPAMLYCNARFVARRVQVNVDRLSGMERSQWAGFAAQKLQLARRYIGGLAGVVLGGSRNQIMSGPLVGVPQAGDTEFERVLARVADANVRNQKNYVPQPYDGRITVIRAEHRFSEPYEEPALGWSPLARGGVDLRIAPGDHAEMTTAPLVNELARILDECLQAAHSRYAAAG